MYFEQCQKWRSSSPSAEEIQLINQIEKNAAKLERVNKDIIDLASQVMGKTIDSEIISNYRDEQEISMLSLHLLQNCISYINTLLIEQLFTEEPYWERKLGKEDYRALTALFYSHINPYGTFELDLSKRLIIQRNGVIA